MRKKCVIVLAHPSLNDIVKLKSNIRDVAKFIEDEDESIVHLVKSYFCELDRKSS